VFPTKKSMGGPLAAAKRCAYVFRWRWSSPLIAVRANNSCRSELLKESYDGKRDRGDP
jgi:hypothetical protein